MEGTRDGGWRMEDVAEALLEGRMLSVCVRLDGSGSGSGWILILPFTF